MWNNLLFGITLIERSLLFIVLFMYAIEKFPNNGKLRKFFKNIKSHFKK